MSIKDLTTRWQSSTENDKASERIFNICTHGGVLSMDQSPFGRLEGDLIDFRGYAASNILVKDVSIKDADFSYATFASAWLEANRFEDSLFIKTDFLGASDHGNIFNKCVFENCNFKMAGIGDKGSRYQNCIFNGCNFQGAVFIRAEFVNTDFLNCRLKDLDFNASSFENCSFEGSLEDVWFRGQFPSLSLTETFGKPKINKMTNVSFENAELIDPTFSDDCDLSTVKVKNNGRYFKFDQWFERLQFLAKQIESWDDENQRSEGATFVKVYSVHALKQEWDIINVGDLEKSYGIDVAPKIIDTLNSFSPDPTR